MPSLYDMFQPKSLVGEPMGYGDAVASRGNSLVGLGLGLMAQRPGETDALRGYMSGAGLDQRAEAERAQLARQKLQDARQASHEAFQRSQAAQAQRNWEQTFARSDPAKAPTEFGKISRDLGLVPGTPEYAEAAKQFYQPKTEGDWSVQTDEETGQKYAWNKRTNETKPIAPPGTAAAPADPFTAGAGQPVYGAGGNYSTPPISPAAPAPGGPATLPPRTGPKAFEPEQKLRKEFEDVAKPYIVARQAFTKMQASQDNAAGDIALIFGYMKMLDPPSTVREGEFATAQNSGGIEDRIRNTYNKLLSGERLTPAQREQFKGQGAAVWQQYNSEYQPRIAQFRDIAQRYRIDPKNVIPDLGPDPVVPERTQRPAAAPSAERSPTQRIQEGGLSRPSNLPKGSAFSPSLGVWRSPEGVFFDGNGRRYPDQSQFKGQ